MSLSEPTVLDNTISPKLLDALAFDAPYVVQRLIKDSVVNSEVEGERLFAEVKRYLVLCESKPDVVVGMYSTLVDEAWHTFILYTAQYIEFGNRFFGRYLGHAPTDGPEEHGANSGSLSNKAELTFVDFRWEYEMLFKEPLPDVWYNMRNIGPARRIVNHSAGAMTAVRSGSQAQLVGDSGDVILSASDIVYDALEFIARTGAFYVRELPGQLTEDEKVILIRSLISTAALAVAP